MKYKVLGPWPVPEGQSSRSRARHTCKDAERGTECTDVIMRAPGGPSAKPRGRQATREGGLGITKLAIGLKRVRKPILKDVAVIGKVLANAGQLGENPCCQKPVVFPNTGPHP